MTNSTALIDRLSAHRRSRMPLAVTGAAVLGLSMLLSVGPVLGAANNGNGNSSNGGTHGTSGNLKVHDASTGVESAGTDNEPHVCAFWLGFEFDAPYESGTWVVVSWAPTGDGSTVASGVYSTAGDGVDNSGPIELPAGHYRVEWAASGATSSKKKTFWVDADCGQAASTQDEETQPEDVTPPTDAPGSQEEETQPEELAPPTDAPGSQEEETQPEELAPPTDAPGSQDEETQPEELAPPTDAPGSQDEETQPEDVTPPTDAPGSQDEETQPEELVLADQESAPQDEAPTDESPSDEAPSDEESATDPEDAAPTDQEDAPPAEQQPEEDATSDDDVAPPADAPSEDEPAQGADHGSTDPGTPPTQDELSNIGGLDGPTMADTATPYTPFDGGQFAGIALLLLVGGHAAIRRDRLIPPTRN